MPDDFTVPTGSRDKLWICKICDYALKWGKLPAQTKTNSLDL